MVFALCCDTGVRSKEASGLLQASDRSSSGNCAGNDDIHVRVGQHPKRGGRRSGAGGEGSRQFPQQGSGASRKLKPREMTTRMETRIVESLGGLFWPKSFP